MRTCATFFLLALLPALAQTDPVTLEADWIAHDFKFASGESMPELRMHYVICGTPQRDALGRIRNAVLLLHDQGSSSQPFLSGGFLGTLFLDGQPLDAQKYFLIMPDAIGHGESSKPSDGMHAGFPHYEDADMVRMQYMLVREALHVDHLKLVLGAGMGGRQTWMWGETYPDFMDALMPLASAPAQIAGRERMFNDMVADAIRGDPAWNGGEYTSAPRGLLLAQYLQNLMLTSAAQAARVAPSSDVADAQFQTFKRRAPRITDANDMLYQYESSRNYDPGPGLPRIKAPVYAINFADDDLVAPGLDITNRAIARLQNSRYILVPASDETRGHATALRARVWRGYLDQLLARIRDNQ
jgi:homoserine O-acetyltransferase